MIDKQSLTVVIPAYNAGSHIDRCIKSVFAMSDAFAGKDYKIIVVDDGSDDDTAARVKKYPVKLLRLDENRGRIRAREAGAEAAETDIVLFVDVKVELEKDLLLNFWRTGYLPVITGRLLENEKSTFTPEERFFYLIRRKYYGQYFKPTRPVYITKGNFNKVPKGATCLFVEKRDYLEWASEANAKEMSDDTAFFEYLVFQKNKKVLKDPAIKITYHQRTDRGELARWVVFRGMTHFSFYFLRRSFLKNSFIILNILLLVMLVTAVVNPANILIYLVSFVLLYLFSCFFFMERASDWSVVVRRLWKYILCFYYGILKAWAGSFRN